MKIAVLGAGVIGISSAWFLAERGHEVVVVERQEAPGLETSFANGGQISVSHSEPWANPQAPLQVLRWLGKEDAPLLFRLRADPDLLTWGARFLLECLPGRTRKNTLDILALALFSRSTLQRLRAELELVYDQSTRGILHLFIDVASFEAGTHHAHELTARGCAVLVVDRDQCLVIEPALRFSREPIVGATYAPDDESGDARKFTLALAERCRQRGVVFRFGVTIEALRRDQNRIAGIQVKDAEGVARELGADAYVVCLGSHTPLLLRRVGIRIPVYPVKGYSVTIPIDDPEGAPQVSVTDEAHKIVMTPLGERLRAAGTAEVAGYDLTLNEVRCNAIRDRARAWFPRASDYSRVEYWAGLRPATPGNVPIIGRTRYLNLFLNTGHGTLGWTLACGSGRALAAIVDGEAPGVEFPFDRVG